MVHSSTGSKTPLLTAVARKPDGDGEYSTSISQLPCFSSMAKRVIQHALTITHPLGNSNQPVIAKNLEPAHQEIGKGRLTKPQ